LSKEEFLKSWGSGKEGKDLLGGMFLGQGNLLPVGEEKDGKKKGPGRLMFTE